MSAKLNLLPRKEFEITLSDKTVIKGQFGTWAIKRFCDRRKISFTQISENFDLDHIVDMILCAVEYLARKQKQPFSFTDIDVCDWIDDLGGIADPNIMQLIGHMNNEETLASPEDNGEKKTEILPGATSSEATILQEAQ